MQYFIISMKDKERQSKKSMEWSFPCFSGESEAYLFFFLK